MVPDDKLSATLAEMRSRHFKIRLVTGEWICQSDRHAWPCHAYLALAAVDAALSHHERIPLYGNAATEDDPGACPHHPDSDLHFESTDEPGEWLCGGKPEGAVCSCTESSDGERLPYPCDEVTDILAALTGGEKSGG